MKKYTAANYQTMPLEELQKIIEKMYRNNEFEYPRKRETDENGTILLDPNDPRDVEWYRNDQDYSPKG